MASANQIAYWKMRNDYALGLANYTENKRHNVSTEGETARHNRRTESTEAARVNSYIATNERTAATNEYDAETRRLVQIETERANKVKEQQYERELYLQARRETENARHNKAGESETNRHNTEVEKETERYQRNKTATDWIRSGADMINGLTKSAGGIMNILSFIGA